MSSQSVPTSSDPFNFNLPSPLPLPSISDTAFVQNSAPTSSFSFFPTQTLPQPQATTLRNSNTLQEGRLPPSISETLIPNIIAPAPTTSVNSISLSLQYGANRVRQPAFYTSSFRLSHMYSQQPPCASWATHRQYNTFNPFYSPQNVTHIHQHLQQNFPTSPGQPTFLPQAQNIGLHYRDRPAHIYSRNVSLLHQGRLHAQQQQQHHAMMQYTANQHRMMMVQSLRSPFQQHYQHIVSPVTVPISPPHATGIGVTQELPLGYSELFRTPPAPPTSPRQQVPWTGSNTIHFSSMPPERYYNPEERTIVGVYGPIHSSRVQTPPSYPQCVLPQTRPIDLTIVATQSEQQPLTTENQQAHVIFESPSLPVLQPNVTLPRINTPTTVAPNKTSTIIRPIPIRPLPPSTTFSWPRSAACPTPQATVSHLTPANVIISHLTPVYREEKSPTEQITKGLKGRKKQKATTDAPVKLPADVPNFSGENLEDAKGLQGEVILISEGDIDVGEQVIVETDRQGSSHITIDKKLEEYKRFVSDFKLHRLRLGWSLVDVTQQVGHRYGKRITLRTITNFEDLVMDKKSYTPLMEILKLWMKDTIEDTTKITTLQYHSIVPLRLRKKRTWVNAQVIRGLEEVFANRKNPTINEIKKMAVEWNVGKDYVRSWFCNRRRRERKRHIAVHAASARMLDPGPSVVLSQVEGTKIPSLTYDITIEVSSHHPRDQWSLLPYTIYIWMCESKTVFCPFFFGLPVCILLSLWTSPQPFFILLPLS